MKKFIKFLIRNVPRPVLIRGSYLFSIIIRPFYFGNNVECPICCKRFRKFLPYGSKAKDNRLCPYCLSLERHRLIWLYLNNHSDFFKREYKVLHFAPEQPFIKRFKRLQNLDYTTADIVSPIADIHIDITKIPLNDNSYDIVFANHVLEHVTDDIAAMKEIFRILKPEGWAILQVPVNYSSKITLEDPSVTTSREREKLFGQYDHVRLHGLDYPERLKTAGFSIEEFDVKKYYTNEILKYRLDEQEILYIAKKH